eukprot:5145715-Prymnesium_polylepis.1
MPVAAVQKALCSRRWHTIRAEIENWLRSGANLAGGQKCLRKGQRESSADCSSAGLRLSSRRSRITEGGAAFSWHCQGKRIENKIKRSDEDVRCEYSCVLCDCDQHARCYMYRFFGFEHGLSKLAKLASSPPRAR